MSTSSYDRWYWGYDPSDISALNSGERWGQGPAGFVKLASDIRARPALPPRHQTAESRRRHWGALYGWEPDSAG